MARKDRYVIFLARLLGDEIHWESLIVQPREEEGAILLLFGFDNGTTLCKR